MARYLVPDHAIGAKGRKVKCAKCAHSWFCTAPEPEVDDSLKDLNALLSEINVRPPGVSKDSNLPALRGIASHRQKIKAFAGFMVVAFFLAAYYMPSLIGQPPSKGLIINDMNFVKLGGDESKLYQITGKITNTTSKVLDVPLLRVTLVDDYGNSLQYWEFTDPAENIGPWNKLPFDTGALNVTFHTGTRFVVEIGSPMELALRSKPTQVITKKPQTAEEKKTTEG